MLAASASGALGTDRLPPACRFSHLQFASALAFCLGLSSHLVERPRLVTGLVFKTSGMARERRSGGSIPLLYRGFSALSRGLVSAPPPNIVHSAPVARSVVSYWTVSAISYNVEAR